MPLRTRAEQLLRNSTPARRMRTDVALERLSALPGAQRVLDAGCDVGLLSMAIARRFPSWTIEAVDVNDEMLERGRRWAAEEGLSQISYRHADVTKDLPEATYDVVVALECLTVIGDLDAALAGMAGALVPGGRFVAHVPDRDWEPVLPGSAGEWDTAVRHGFSADELAERLDGHGLRVTWTRATMRTPLHAAQELYDRSRDASLKVKLALHPLHVTAAALERHGLAFGPARGLYVEAVRR